MGDFDVWGRSPVEITAAVTPARSAVWHWALFSLPAGNIRQSRLLFVFLGSSPTFSWGKIGKEMMEGSSRENPPQGVPPMAVSDWILSLATNPASTEGFWCLTQLWPAQTSLSWGGFCIWHFQCQEKASLQFLDAKLFLHRNVVKQRSWSSISPDSQRCWTVWKGVLPRGKNK